MIPFSSKVARASDRNKRGLVELIVPAHSYQWVGVVSISELPHAKCVLFSSGAACVFTQALPMSSNWSECALRGCFAPLVRPHPSWWLLRTVVTISSLVKTLPGWPWRFARSFRMIATASLSTAPERLRVSAGSGKLPSGTARSTNSCPWVKLVGVYCRVCAN